MLEILVVLGCLFVIGMLTARLVRKRRANKQPRRREQNPLDRWVEEQVAQALAQKLSVERSVLIKTLRGEPDPDAVTSMEQGVRGIQVAYERMAQAHEAEVRLDITFEDGSTTQARRRVAHDELPTWVRDELARTGGAHVYRPWYFPWSDPDA